MEQTIHNLDCRVGMRNMDESCVDLVIADPPYNIGKDYGDDSDDQKWEEFYDFTTDWMREALRILKPTGSIYVFMGIDGIADLFLIMKRRFNLRFNSWITWHYTQGEGRTRGFSSRHEDILFFTKGETFRFFLSQIRVPQKAMRSVNNPDGANPGDVWSIPHVHCNKAEWEDHPTQKPVAVIERMVSASSSPGDLVVDPFSGSGTTARACKNLHREFVGFETNPIFYKNSILSLTKNSEEQMSVPVNK